jgi:hypothetical protein
MGAGLPQVVPIFGQVNLQIRLRPEEFRCDVTSRTFQRNIVSDSMRINAPATARAFNIAGCKATLRSTLAHKPEAISVSGNSHSFTLMHFPSR